MILLGLKFWPKVVFFGSMKDAGIFLGHEKRTKGFFGYAKQSSDLFGLTDFEVVIFWGIKCEPPPPPPPPPH